MFFSKLKITSFKPKGDFRQKKNPERNQNYGKIHARPRASDTHSAPSVGITENQSLGNRPLAKTLLPWSKDAHDKILLTRLTTLRPDEKKEQKNNIKLMF